MTRRVAPAATDEQLAAAEQTESIRRRDREAADADRAEQERLAAAGEPESEKAQREAAVRASASVMSSTPIPPEEPKDDTSDTPRRVPRPRKKNEQKLLGLSERPPVRKRAKAEISAPFEKPELPHPVGEEDPEKEEALRAKSEKLAWKLMDTAYKKWSLAAKKDLGKANKELAVDLGKDAVLYFQNGIIRMNDLHATIEKLTASAKAGKDNPDGEEDLDDELELLREKLRDGK